MPETGGTEGMLSQSLTRSYVHLDFALCVVSFDPAAERPDVNMMMNMYMTYGTPHTPQEVSWRTGLERTMLFEL